MKTTLSIALVLVGMLTLAGVQDEPLQVWLLALAPLALLAIAWLLHINDSSKSGNNRVDGRVDGK